MLEEGCSGLGELSVMKIEEGGEESDRSCSDAADRLDCTHLLITGKKVNPFQVDFNNQQSTCSLGPTVRVGGVIYNNKTLFI